MPPTHMFAHHRGGQRQPTPGNAQRPSSPTPIIPSHLGVTHTHRTPTWTWTFIKPKPHTHPADIARERDQVERGPGQRGNQRGNVPKELEFSFIHIDLQVALGPTTTTTTPLASS